MAPSHRELLARKILRWRLFINQGPDRKQTQSSSHIRGARLSPWSLIWVQGGPPPSPSPASLPLPWCSVWPHDDPTCFFPNIRIHKCQTQTALRSWVSPACSISLPRYKGLNRDSRGHGVSRQQPSLLQQSQGSSLFALTLTPVLSRLLGGRALAEDCSVEESCFGSVAGNLCNPDPVGRRGGASWVSSPDQGKPSACLLRLLWGFLSDSKLPRDAAMAWTTNRISDFVSCLEFSIVLSVMVILPIEDGGLEVNWPGHGHTSRNVASSLST